MKYEYGESCMDVKIYPIAVMTYNLRNKIHDDEKNKTEHTHKSSAHHSWRLLNPSVMPEITFHVFSRNIKNILMVKLQYNEVCLKVRSIYHDW